MEAAPAIDYKALYEQSQEELLQARGTIAVLRHELDRYKKMLFGRKAERFVPSHSANPSQLALDLNAETVAEVTVTGKKKVEYTRTTVEKRPTYHPGRYTLPAWLRREEIRLEPDDVPPGSIAIGEAVTEVLEITPSELYVKRIIRVKYLIPSNAGNDGSRIIVAPLPVQPIPKCIAGPSLLAQVLIDKYGYHLPCYRQVQRFEHAGITLQYSTIISWIGGTCNLLEVLYEALKKEVLSAGYLQADETGIRVLDRNKAGKKVHNGFFWVYQDSLQKLVFFDYQKNRNKSAPEGMLKDFKGHLQTDGYEVYDKYDKKEGVIHLNCMAHARRYFVEALKKDKERAEYVLERMQQLYAIERRCRDAEYSFEKTRKVRQGESVPILEKLGKWMNEQLPEVLPKSPIGKALAYSVKRWEKLCRYTEDGMLQIDSNLIENSIRPLALGRKNFLFIGSHDAAPRTAMMYSLLGCCKMHGINPLEWLTDVLAHLPMHPINRLKELLPHNWKPFQIVSSNVK
ncbi:IS66 family transposase [Paraflavisolibacter sp. H34]|uniref:IS66 family transposase n=1 Tax=Huijunlia imazamoxiresistens TaxID=3127457 RepID=UPI00301740DF